MTDSYPYAEKRANARRWLNERRAVAYLGDHWLLARPQPKKQQPKRLELRRSISRDVDIDIKVPTLRHLVSK
jgi:hypothetical protein